jgi:hypothetical protein
VINAKGMVILKFMIWVVQCGKCKSEGEVPLEEPTIEELEEIG